MEPNDNSSESSSFSRDEKVEALDLLEECWYFDNMLNIRPTIPRCHSDPSPSYGLICPDFLGKDSDVSSYSSTSKPPNNSGSVPPKKIQRAPSMPPLRVKEEDKSGMDFTRGKLMHQSPSSKPHNSSGSVPPKRIQRAPSMPPLLVRDEDEKKGRKLVHQSLDTEVVQAASKPQSAKMKGHHKSDCNKRKSKLLRTPSLPSSIGRDEKFQVNGPPRTGRSPKQPSTPTSVDNLPPRQPSKVL